MASRLRDEMPAAPSGHKTRGDPDQPEHGPADGSLLHTEGSIPGAQTPVEVEGLKLGKAHTSAAGIEGVRQSLRYVWGRMGLARGTRALLKLNQVDGFDCQSCAWPSPDEHRHATEFCENGAKAVSDEGTRRRVNPEFFSAHPVSDLLRRSDFWLNEQGRLTHPMVKTESSDRYEPIPWEEAFAMVAKELNDLESPDEAAFY